MSQEIAWEYVVSYCYFKVTKKGGLTHGDDGYWALNTDGKEYSLSQGLSLLGSAGYELVGIQPVEMRTGRYVRTTYIPTFFYIFKKPQTREGSTAQ
jgi:hypothetical protein